MNRVEVINSKGCSRLFSELTTSSLRGQTHMASPSSSSSSLLSRSAAPFSGLIICVTGLSKEARKQVMDATERLGGQYSPNLHPQCTHLVVQSYGGRKFEHALKHGFRNGLFVVTLGWFVDSVRRNVRLGESLYGVKNLGENGNSTNDLHFAVVENACLPVRIFQEADKNPPEKEFKKSCSSTLSSCSLYIDTDISPELKQKVAEAAKREGATLLNWWFVGQSASHVVCEATSAHKYLGHSTNLVTPLWVLKTAKESRIQKVVHVSSDLARRVGTMLDNVQNGICTEDNKNDGKTSSVNGESHGVQENSEAYVQIVNAAKDGVRKRRCKRMQSCQTPIRPITPNTLLDSICWSISEPTSSASIYSDISTIVDANMHHTSLFFDAKDSEDSFVNFSRPLAESDKSDLILKNHFLTILFPVDRFSELGPYSRTFFSDSGFTAMKTLDLIYSFYQEKMSVEEIEVAIHTDSKHADLLRSMYSSSSNCRLEFKRIDFLGSRKSFEMLKRVTGDNNNNVYELLIRA